VTTKEDCKPFRVDDMNQWTHPDMVIDGHGASPAKERELMATRANTPVRGDAPHHVVVVGGARRGSNS
jgi:hypothetical protein